MRRPLHTMHVQLPTLIKHKCHRHWCCFFLPQVRQWNIWGLPKDDLSTENAIAIDKGKVTSTWQPSGTSTCITKETKCAANHSCAHC